MAARKAARKKTARKNTPRKVGVTRQDHARRRRKAARKPNQTRKQCARCLHVKALEEFGDNPRMKLGKKSYCRDCAADLQREWTKGRLKGSSRKTRPGRKPARTAKRTTTGRAKAHRARCLD